MSAISVKIDVIIRHLVLNSDHPFRAEYFNSLIVSVNSSPAVVYCSKSAVVKRQGYHGCIPVTNFLEHWINQNICLCINFYDIRPHEIARHIKIVDGHVQKNSTRGAEIIFGGWGRIAASNP